MILKDKGFLLLIFIIFFLGVTVFISAQMQVTRSQKIKLICKEGLVLEAVVSDFVTRPFAENKFAGLQPVYDPIVEYVHEGEVYSGKLNYRDSLYGAESFIKGAKLMVCLDPSKTDEPYFKGFQE